MLSKLLFSSAKTEEEIVKELQNAVAVTERRIKRGQDDNDNEYVIQQLKMLRIYTNMLKERRVK